MARFCGAGLSVSFTPKMAASRGSVGDKSDDATPFVSSALLSCVRLLVLLALSALMQDDESGSRLSLVCAAEVHSAVARWTVQRREIAIASGKHARHSGL